MPPRPPRTLDGHVAVVTGSSSGIGRAIALELASAGANVVVHARESLAAAEDVANEIESRGVESRLQLADISGAAACDELADSCWNWKDRIDIWINNAGADVLTGPAADWPFEQKLNQLWAVDVLGTVRLSKIVGPRMRAAGGVILNMGWDQAELGMEGDSGEMFATAKGAVMTFSRSLARSLAPRVRVNCLAPGWIKTAWGEEASAYWQERAKEESLLERWGTPQDVAATARFLVSPESGFMTGQTVCVNGGKR